jgi:hypothetical protein
MQMRGGTAGGTNPTVLLVRARPLTLWQFGFYLRNRGLLAIKEIRAHQPLVNADRPNSRLKFQSI